MNRSSRWIGQRETLVDFLIALALNLIFLIVSALVLWPWGRAMLAFRLTKGFAIFWVISLITAVALSRIQRFLRVDADRHIDAYVISNLMHGVLLLTGWSAFAALSVAGLRGGTGIWADAIVWGVGLVSSLVAVVVVTFFHRGSVYRIINVAVALLSFLAFALLAGWRWS